MARKTAPAAPAAIDATALATAIATAIASVLAPALAGTAPVVTAPVAPAPAADAHVGPSGKPDGRRFACTADGGCGRLLRSAARAAVHGVEQGHAPAKAS